MSSPAPAAPPAEPSHSSRLSTTRSHLAYLANPKNSPAPKSLVTRSSLKTFRYVLKFVFWRLLRYAVRTNPVAAVLHRADLRFFEQKYTLIAAGSAALAGTVIGTALPWVGALVFPSVPVAAAMGATTALIKVRPLPPSFPPLADSEVNSSHGDIEETISVLRGLREEKVAMRGETKRGMRMRRRRSLRGLRGGLGGRSGVGRRRRMPFDRMYVGVE